MTKPKHICTSSGGVDAQINGALGVTFNDLDEQTASRLPEICDFLWQQGVDAFLPTLVTTSLPNLHRSLAFLQDFYRQPPAPGCAAMLGVHLEGPFLHPAKRGAHPEAHLRRLTLANLQEVLGPYTAIVKVVTLAPELDAANSTIAWLQERGILVSLGHSTATAAQARAAFGRGAGAITHTFNAMPPLHHREIGLLGAALLQEDVWCGLIADGVHVDPLAIALLWRLKGKHIVLVSDALAPLGLPDGPYPWDDRTMVVTKGTARLSDGTLAGTTLPLLAGVQNLVAWGICRAEEAIALATETPRQMLGLPPARHSLNWYEQPDGQLVWARADEPATIALP